MALNTYTAKINLVLTRTDGSSYRVAAGERVALTPEQYEDVAAYVSAVPESATPAEPVPAPPAPLQDKADSDGKKAK